MDDDDDEISFSVDPYDVLQEHDLNINRIFVAHNNLANAFEKATEALVKMNQRIDQLEQQIATPK
jgi:hypothetical protein